MRQEATTDPRAPGACPDIEAGGAADLEDKDGLKDVVAAVVEVLAARFERVAGSLKTLLAVHTDRAQLAIRKRLQLAILGLLGVLAGGTATIYATLVAIRGASEGIGLALGRPWLGSLVAGLGVLALLGGAVTLVFWRWNRKELANQLEKYEKLRRERRAAPGTRLADSAAPN